MTDTARKSMLETLTHAIVSVTVIAAATVLAALHSIDAASWAGAVAAGIGISGGVSVLQGRASNGKMVEEARELVQIPGGRRFTDPDVPHGHEAPPPVPLRYGIDREQEQEAPQ